MKIIEFAEKQQNLWESLGDVSAIEPLVKALQDEDEDVRKCAVIALEKIGDKRAVVPLVKALQDDFF